METPSATSPWIGQMRDAVERREHAANVQRMRLGVQVGVVIWIAFALPDWAMAHWTYSVGVTEVWASRFGILPLILTLLWILTRTHPTPRMLTRLDLCIFATISASTGWNAAHLGGIASPYTSGALLVMMARGMCVIEPWQQGVKYNALIVGAHVATLVICAGFMPTVSAQLASPGLIVILVVQVAQLVAAIGIIAIGSHTSWSIRRSLFEQGRIAHYRLLELLGQGGQSEVWRAYDDKMQRDVALKLSRTAAVDRRAFVRFAREVEVLSRLGRDEIVQVYDSGVTEEGVWYLAMELLQGVDLGNLIRVEGPIKPERAARLCAQVASGLSVAHQGGVLHRDVKPENIFVVDSGMERERAKLLDFGVAGLCERDRAAALTQTGGIVGTPAFMAPEVARGRTGDERADIYSLGASLFFALTGVPPFVGEDDDAMLRAIVTASPPPITESAKYGVPAPLANLLSQCLEKTPQKRPASATEVAGRLFAAAGPPAPAAEVTQSVPGRVWTRKD